MRESKPRITETPVEIRRDPSPSSDLCRADAGIFLREIGIGSRMSRRDDRQRPNYEARFAIVLNNHLVMKFVPSAGLRPSTCSIRIAFAYLSWNCETKMQNVAAAAAARQKPALAKLGTFSYSWEENAH